MLYYHNFKCRIYRDAVKFDVAQMQHFVSSNFPRCTRHAHALLRPFWIEIYGLNNQEHNC
jgi:hypothetical protein